MGYQVKLSEDTTLSFWVLELSTVSPHLYIPNYLCLSLSLKYPKPSRTFPLNYSSHLFPQRGLNVPPISKAVVFAWFCRQVKAILLNKPLFPLSFQLGCYLEIQIRALHYQIKLHLWSFNQGCGERKRSEVPTRKALQEKDEGKPWRQRKCEKMMKERRVKIVINNRNFYFPKK